VLLSQGRHGRMHDRMVFERAAAANKAWTVKRLQP
jgi:pyridoxine/pyridoxamine 5'-phosphate oxidase